VDAQRQTEAARKAAEEKARREAESLRTAEIERGRQEEGRGIEVAAAQPGKAAVPAAPDLTASAEQALARGNDAAGFALYRQAAERGSAKAQVALGDLYAAGRGVARDDLSAVSWYRKAAMQGESDGQFRLGEMYAAGRGVAQNNFQAYVWFSRAARGGNVAAESKRNQAAAALQPAELRQADKLVR
jgi:TPR repeat protein